MNGKKNLRFTYRGIKREKKERNTVICRNKYGKNYVVAITSVTRSVKITKGITICATRFESCRGYTSVFNSWKKKEISTKRGLRAPRDITKLSPPMKTLENLRLLSIESQEFTRKNNPQNCAPVPLSSGTIIPSSKHCPVSKNLFLFLEESHKIILQKKRND